MTSSNKIKLAKQQAADIAEAAYAHIVAVDFVQRCPRRPVPEACVSDLQTVRCYPRREPDGTWSALDTPRTANLLASYEAKQPKQ